MAPPEDRALGGAERCAFHPSRSAVARCDACGRPLCLGCSTPVRGQVLGPDCLAAVLGSDEPASEPITVPRDRSRTIAGVAFLAAFVATLLPWARSGEGSWGFGAWGTTVKWSLVPAVASTLGVLAWVAAGLRPDLRTPPLRWACAALGLLTAVGGVLAAVRPPAFTDPWFAPWIAAAAGAVAFVAAMTAALTLARPLPRHV